MATTHPVLATAVSIYSSLVKQEAKGSMDAMTDLFKYIKGVQVSPAKPGSGIKVSFDADWAGI